MDSAYGIPSDIRQQVLKRSWSDPEFRDQVQQDPRAALKTLGYDAPDFLKFQVAPQANDTIVLLVADNPAGASQTEGAGEVHVEADWTSDEGNCGSHCTLTAECFCADTLTGRCICKP